MAIVNLIDDVIGNWILNDQHTNRLEQWVDADYQWEALTSGTLDYIHIRGMQAVSWQEDGGYNTVCGNNNKIFLGSKTHGIEYMNKSDLLLDDENPIDLHEYIHTYLVPPKITDFNVRYLHCNNDYIAALTQRGIDIIKHTHPGFISNKLYPTNYLAYKCFVISTGHIYYTLSGTLDWRISKTETPVKFNHANPLDIITGGSILAEGIKLTDLYIAEGTSTKYMKDTIFCATTSGAYIIDEGTSEHYVFTGPNNDHSFNSIWADSDANLNERKAYIASDHYLYVLNMPTKTIYNKLTIEKTLTYDEWDGIRTNTVPINDNIVDINKF